MTPQQSEAAINSVASSQCGLIANWQLRNLGMTDKTAHKRTMSGRWSHVARGVYEVHQTTNSCRKQIWAVALSSERAIVTGLAALFIHGLISEDEVRRHPITSAVSSMCPGPGPGSSSSSSSSSTSVCEVDGMRICSVEEALLAAFSRMSFDQADLIAERAICSNKTTPKKLQRFVDRYGSSGRNGIRAFRHFLRERSPVKKSELEARFVQMVRQYELPKPKYQARHKMRDGTLVYLDAYWPGFKLAVELDGFEYHSSKTSFQYDRSRQNAIWLSGISLLRYTWSDIAVNHDAVANEILAFMNNAKH